MTSDIRPSDNMDDDKPFGEGDLQSVREGIWLCPAEYLPGHSVAPYQYTRKRLLATITARDATIAELRGQQASVDGPAKVQCKVCNHAMRICDGWGCGMDGCPLKKISSI